MKSTDKLISLWKKVSLGEEAKIESLSGEEKLLVRLKNDSIARQGRGCGSLKLVDEGFWSQDL